MSDKPDDDLLAGIDDPDLEGAAGWDDGDVEPIEREERRPGRVVGLVALVLGVVGSVLAVVVAALSLRFAVGATDNVERLLAPIDEVVGRLETRIDQTDDLVGGGAIDADELVELRARVEAMEDSAIGARALADRIADHTVYGRLPAATGGLAEELTWFEDRASEVAEATGGAGPGEPIDDESAQAVAATVNEMQAAVSAARDRIDSTGTSLRRWARVAGLGAFLASLWGLWAQTALARRGWQRLRGDVR